MKIEIDSKKVFINSGNNKEEIHPFWLRERINNEDALDLSLIHISEPTRR